MKPSNPKQFLFIDSDPALNDERKQAIQRTSAKAHAATVSHTTKTKSFREKKQRQVAFDIATNSSPPNLIGGRRTYDGLSHEQSEELDDIDTADVSKAKNAPRSQHYLAYRNRPLGARGTVSKDFPSAEAAHQRRYPKPSIFMHKGNSDPFNAAIIPLNSQQYSLIGMARSDSSHVVWASELSMRPHDVALRDGIQRSFGTLCDTSSFVHANLAFGYLTKAAHQGGWDPKDLNIMKSTKSLALASLRELVAAEPNSVSRTRLMAIKNTSQMLGAIEIYLGKSDIALLHFAACHRVIRMLGGFRTLPAYEVELYTHVLVGQATKTNTRPLVDPDEWDPGPWSEVGSIFQAAEHSIATLDPNESSPSSVQSSDSARTPEEINVYRPSVVCPTLQILLQDMRELTMIEGVKIKRSQLSFSNDLQADHMTRLFRWSHLRTSALRARTMCHWCDISKALSLSQVHGPGQTGPQYHSFDLALCQAMRLLDRCIFHEPYLRTGMFRQSREYYDMLYDSLLKIEPPFGHISEFADIRRYDMLWIYTVGAHTEQAFLPQSGPDGQQYNYCSSRIGPLVAQLDFKDFEEMTQYLEQKYLYCPRLQDVTLRKLISFE